MRRQIRRRRSNSPTHIAAWLCRTAPVLKHRPHLRTRGARLLARQLSEAGKKIMLKSAKVLGLAVAAGALMASGSAHAETDVAFNVGAATDYIFRGIDQTTTWSEGQAFGGVDVTSGSFYAGAWISNTGPHVSQFFEYNFYAGYKPVLGPVTLDLGVIYYGFTDTEDTPASEDDLNTYELKVAGSVESGGVTWGAALFYTPNFSGDADGLDDNAGFYYEANAAYTFSNSATVSGAIGLVEVDDYAVDSYTTWNVGVTYPITENVSLDGRYIGSDDDATLGFGGNGDTLVGTLKVTF